MLFDPDNPIIKLCVQGMKFEQEGNYSASSSLFKRAWEEATNDLEKFSAAHYVARCQTTAKNKLKWDKIALSLALTIGDPQIKSSFPSLYLNVGKNYEDLKNFKKADEYYQVASSLIEFLPCNEYGNMIKSGIKKGLDRLKTG